jgi:hypothetical protein
MKLHAWQPPLHSLVRSEDVASPRRSVVRTKMVRSWLADMQRDLTRPSLQLEGRLPNQNLQLEFSALELSTSEVSITAQLLQPPHRASGLAFRLIPLWTRRFPGDTAFSTKRYS